MEYIFLLAVIILVSLQSVFKKQYNSNSESPSSFTYSCLTSVAALFVFCVISCFKLSFTSSIVPYSIAFAVAFASAMAGSFFAIKYGTLSITILVTSYSLIIPTFYGVFALGDTIGKLGIIGLILLFISIFLINIKKEKIRVNTKWIISLIFAFVGNGMCSLIQKLQQLKFDGEYKSEFMILALTICSVIFVFLAVLTKEKPLKDAKVLFSSASLCGISNGIVNYLVMVLTALIPNVILFPAISAGGIALGFFFALFIYKERLNKIQYIGYFIGTASIILLNI